nr:FAD-dependent monooxygenase [Hyalangium gracile]
MDLRRGHEVRELRQDADGVELAGVADEQPFRCRARYVVGADGARSIVRRE